MSPNKSKRGSDDSPEEKKSKKKKTADENEEEEEKEGSGSSSKMKIPAHLSGSQKPAELFRKDLISAMKLPDSESLALEEYLLIADSWRQEWERGVQVPVNEVGIPEVELRETREADKTTGDFKMPKKMLHSYKDETYRQGCHELTGMSQLAEQVVRYDLDDLDVSWLQRVNEEREEIGETMIHEWTVERVIEALETKCHENMEIKKKTEEGLGIEYDEDIVCEICRSPDSEDSNEMVFCDGCDICVHQACYGIATVPEGSWLCRSCALGIKPSCILCPKIGGAMKSTRSGTKWAHVSCAIWIPEVTIGCVEKMEPITKISEIPASRWSLVCTICKERNGACIQCSVKACKTAFHVTCGFASNLEMKTILIEEGDDDEAVKLKAYCPKHSKKRERNTSESEPDTPRKSVCGTPKKEMTEEEKATLRAERLLRLEEEFYTVINVNEIATSLELEPSVADLIYVYWKLKRKALFNRPLLTPKTEEADLLEKQQEDSLVARMKMFVHLRQDLERVRNLSYMISRREKMKRSLNKARESVFFAALAMLTDKSLKLTEKDIQEAVKQYKDMPSQRCSDQKVGKLKTEFIDLESESDSGVRKSVSTGLISKNRKTLKYESDSDAVSVSSVISKSSVSPESVSSTKGKRGRKVLKKSDTPGPKWKMGDRKSGSKFSRESEDSKTKVEKIEVDLNKPADMDTSISNSTELDSSISNSMDIDVDEVIDVEKTDDTLVKSDTSQDDTVVKSELETSVAGSVSEEKDVERKQGEKRTDKMAETTPKRKGRPPKRKRSKSSESSAKVDTKASQENESKVKVIRDEKIENVKPEPQVPDLVPARTRSSRSDVLPEEKDELEHPVTNEKKKRHSVSTAKPSQKLGLQDKKPRTDTDKKIDKISEGSIRTSESRSLFDTIQNDMIDSLPSGKNIPKDIKAELSGYFRNNKLVVSDVIKQKVQSSLLKCRRNRPFANGIHVSAQKSFDSYLNAPHGECETNNGLDKTVSRILNELSPTRDGLEANNLVSKKLTDCDKISDRVRTRSSRETTPDSNHGGDKNSVGSQHTEKLTKRPSSRASIGRGHEDVIDVENIYNDGVTRKTRSMDVDEKKLRGRSNSPATLLQKNTQRIIS